MLLQDFVAQRVQELCDKQKMSRYRLSQLTGISQPALKKIFEGSSIPGILTLDKICSALGMSLSQFFQPWDTGNGYTSQQNEMLELWCSLSEENRELSKTIMKSLSKK